MQLTAFGKGHLLLVFFLAALGLVKAPQANAQQGQSRETSPRITLQEKNVSLKKVFNDISRKTGLSVMYDESLVKGLGPVSVDARDASLAEVLRECLRGKALTFTIEGNTITIRKLRQSVAQETPESSSTFPHINIVGKVTDEQGTPLTGVTISVKGGGFSMATQATGGFFMGGVPDKGVIVFTCVGYEPQQIKYDARTNFNIRMKKRVTEMGSVSVEVNNGYQVLPLERTTGSYDLVDNKLFNRSISPDLMDHLNGVVSGVSFDNREQGIGAAIKSYTAQGNVQNFSIRGLSTITSNPTPLIVVDGFPYNPTLPFDQNLNNLNPNDIESMTVLKDAAAASIWGARAGNGVLVITTKAGKFNQAPRVSAGASVTVTGKPRLFTQRIMSTPDYISIEKSLYAQGGYSNLLDPATAEGKPISEVVALLDQVSNGTLSQADADAQIDALSKIDVRNDIRKYMYATGVDQAYHVDVSGGGANNNYRLAAGYDDGKAVDFSYQKRFTLSGGYGFRLFKGLDLNLPMEISNNMLGSNYGSQSNLANGIPPYSKLADASGKPQNVIYGNGWNEDFIQTALNEGLYDMEYNPINQFRAPQYDHKTENLVQFTPSLGYTWKGLTARLTYQYSRTTSGERRYASDSVWNVKNNINNYTQVGPNGQLQFPINRGGTLDVINSVSVTNNLRASLEYDRRLAANHRIHLTAGYERNEVRVDGSNDGWYGYNPSTGTVQSVVDYVTYWTQTNSILSKSPYPYTSTIYPEAYGAGINGAFTALISSFGVLGYEYKSRYIFTGSARIDEANLFGVDANAKKRPQWSGGFKWDLNKESFYKAHWLPLLDFRATYGIQGNLPATDVRSLATVTYYPSTVYSAGLPSAELNNPPNPNLTWESVATTNVGMDFAAKKNVLSGKVDYYIKKETDLILTYPVDPTSGTYQLSGNVGAMISHGLEITLNSNNITTKNFRWSSRFLLSHNIERLTKSAAVESATQILENQADNSSAGIPSALVGRPVYGVYSLKWGGLDAQGNPQGYDTLGKLSEDYNQLSDYMRLKDLVYHGSAKPTTTGSLMNDFTYKGFTLSVNITYNLGYYFHAQSVNYGEIFGYGASVLGMFDGSSDFDKRWQKPGDEKHTYVPSMPTLADNSYGRDQFYSFASVNVQNAGNIRLKDVSLGYDLSPVMPKRSPFSSASLHVYYVSNQLLWTANKLGIDPDYSAMKPAQSCSLGLNLGLK